MLDADLGILFIGSTYPMMFLILLHCLSPLMPRVGLSKSLFLAKPVSRPVTSCHVQNVSIKRKFHFFLRFCTCKRSKTDILIILQVFFHFQVNFRYRFSDCDKTMGEQRLIVYVCNEQELFTTSYVLHSNTED